MSKQVKVGSRLVGDGQPIYFIGEIGLNHNGSLDICKQLIDVAVLARCDAVKFQKRTPEICVPPDQRDKLRETPWGTMTYMDYRHKIEFGESEYGEIAKYCADKKIDWMASCWDEPSVDLIDRLDPVGHKVASASLTDDALLKKMAATGRPMFLSTGMSTMEEIKHAVSVLSDAPLLIAHSTSAYPCASKELNLRMIRSLNDIFDAPIGYSGHEVGLTTTMGAVGLGATFVERHITLDRTMWGSDHAASIEPLGLQKLVRDIRDLELALGNGVKQVYESEIPLKQKLRRV